MGHPPVEPGGIILATGEEALDVAIALSGRLERQGGDLGCLGGSSLPHATLQPRLRAAEPRTAGVEVRWRAALWTLTGAVALFEVR